MKKLLSNSQRILSYKFFNKIITTCKWLNRFKLFQKFMKHVFQIPSDQWKVNCRCFMFGIMLTLYLNMPVCFGLNVLIVLDIKFYVFLIFLACLFSSDKSFYHFFYCICLICELWVSFHLSFYCSAFICFQNIILFACIYVSSWIKNMICW